MDNTERLRALWTALGYTPETVERCEHGIEPICPECYERQGEVHRLFPLPDNEGVGCSRFHAFKV